MLPRISLVLALVLAWAAPARAEVWDQAWSGAWAWAPPLRPALAMVPALGVMRERASEAPLRPYVDALERLRGLKFRHPVPWSVKSADGVRKFMQEVMDRDYPLARSEFDQVALGHMGLVPRDFEIRTFLEDLFTEQIQGAYDPAVGEFFVVRVKRNWLNRVLTAGGPSEQDLVTIHELDHALQDQVFDLEALMKSVATPRSSDREMALQALVEGDATLVMIHHMMTLQGQPVEAVGDVSWMTGLLTNLPGLGNFSNAPLYFKRAMIFPYYTGMDLVNAVRNVGGWELVNKMYEDPPQSTEQVLHPESYFYDRDPPKQVDLSALPSNLRGWKSLGEDTGGEFLVRLFLEEKGASDPEMGGTGWGGDRFRVYRRGDRTLLVWLTVWDDEEEATEFEKMARSSVGSGWSLWRAGDRVALVEGAPKELLPALRQGLAAARVRVPKVDPKVLVQP